MGIKNESILVEKLTKLGFLVQREDGDLYFVRPSHRNDLFESIELLFAGRKNDVILPGIDLAVVRSVAVRFSGLVEGDGLEEMCTDPENGRVHFSGSHEVLPWIERLVEIAPTKARTLAHERGEELLLRTEVARTAAERAFEQFVAPVLPRGLGALAAATDKQREIVSNLSSRPMVIGSKTLRAEYVAALTALTLAEDPDLCHLGQVAVLESRGLGLIRQMKEVPDHVMWKIRILVDLILRNVDRRTGH